MDEDCQTIGGEGKATHRPQKSMALNDISQIASRIDGSNPVRSIDPRLRPYVNRVAARFNAGKTGPGLASQEQRRGATRILVVDDDPIIRDLLAVVLHEAGLAYDVAASGTEAIALIGRQAYDVAVVDMVMPDLHGLEVIRAIRRRSAATRVIVLTGSDDVESVGEGTPLRADHYLLKPFEVEEFLASVERLLARQEALRDTRLTHEREQLARQLAHLCQNLKGRFVGGAVALATALEGRHPFTRGHSSRVAVMSAELGRALDFPSDQLDELVVGALLHDIGKTAVCYAISPKNAKLSQKDSETIKQHARAGYDILFPFFGRSIVTECVLWHHEHWDGGGYPAGLAGEEIPVAGRVIALCDAFDTLTSDRPCSARLSESEALEEVEANRARQFDPRISQLFCALCFG